MEGSCVEDDPVSSRLEITLIVKKQYLYFSLLIYLNTIVYEEEIFFKFCMLFATYFNETY